MSAGTGAPARRRVLVVRLDSVGDVILAGPAARALAAGAEVDVLCSGIGRPAAELLPGVSRVLRFDSPWILRDGPPLDRPMLDRLVDLLAAGRYDAAAVLTSSHQSPLPMAMALRLAGVPEIAAVSVDFPGQLLDHRIPGDPDVHEVERGLLVAGALGAPAPADDRLRLLVETPEANDGRVVVHPGSSAPARTLSAPVWREATATLAQSGYEVVVTASPDEAPLAREVAGSAAADVVVVPLADLGGLATVIGTAAAVVTGNTGPMHVAAAMGRPVVAVFAPTVPWARWRPWRVPHRQLGDLDVPCAGCRQVRCPFERQPCLAAVGAAAVATAVAELISHPRPGGRAMTVTARHHHVPAVAPPGRPFSRLARVAGPEVAP